MAAELEKPCEEEVETEEVKDVCMCASGPSAFTISEKALEKIKNKRSSGQYAAQAVILAELEEKWINREKCLEKSHSEKWGYTKGHLDEMEARLLKNFDLLQPCPSEKEVVSCYKTAKHGIECRDAVVDYIACIEQFTRKIVLRAGAVSCVKARPKTKLFN